MKYPLAVIVLLTSLSAGAQSIFLKGGASFPSGNYGNTDLFKSQDAFAGTGAFGSLEVIYPLYKKLNIVFEAGYASHNMAADEMASQLQAGQPGITSVVIKNDKGYGGSYAMTGAGIELGRNRFAYGVKVTGGFLTIRTPEFNTVYTTTQTNAVVTRTVYTAPSSGNAFVISWGAYGIVHLPENFELKLFLDYMNSTVSLKKEYTSSNQQYGNLYYEVYQAGLGLGYRF